MLTIPPASLRARGRRPLALTAAVTVATASLLTGCGSAQAPQPAATGGTAASQQTQQAGGKLRVVVGNRRPRCPGWAA